MCYGGTIIFLPGPSDAFHSYFNGNEEYEQSFCSNSDVSWFGYWQQFEEMASARQSSIASGASNNSNASEAKWKLLIQLRGENHALLESQESRTCSVGKNLRKVNSVDLVMYMLISEILVKTCSSNVTSAKIWNLRNFCQFFAHQKLEVNKISSRATWP